MSDQIKHIFTNYFEIVVFSVGLLLMALMDPTTDYKSSWCLYEMAGINFCPGEGLGHSIAYTFRGNIHKAMEANILGPLSVIILTVRIGTLVRNNLGLNFKKEN